MHGCSGKPPPTQRDLYAWLQWQANTNPKRPVCMAAVASHHQPKEIGMHGCSGKPPPTQRDRYAWLQWQATTNPKRPVCMAAVASHHQLKETCMHGGSHVCRTLCTVTRVICSSLLARWTDFLGRQNIVCLTSASDVLGLPLPCSFRTLPVS